MGFKKKNICGCFIFACVWTSLQLSTPLCLFYKNETATDIFYKNMSRVYFTESEKQKKMHLVIVLILISFLDWRWTRHSWQFVEFDLKGRMSQHVANLSAKSQYFFLPRYPGVPLCYCTKLTFFSPHHFWRDDPKCFSYILLKHVRKWMYYLSPNRS